MSSQHSFQLKGEQQYRKTCVPLLPLWFSQAGWGWKLTEGSICRTKGSISRSSRLPIRNGNFLSNIQFSICYWKQPFNCALRCNQNVYPCRASPTTVQMNGNVTLVDGKLTPKKGRLYDVWIPRNKHPPHRIIASSKRTTQNLRLTKGNWVLLPASWTDRFLRNSTVENSQTFRTEPIQHGRVSDHIRIALCVQWMSVCLSLSPTVGNWYRRRPWNSAKKAKPTNLISVLLARLFGAISFRFDRSSSFRCGLLNCWLAGAVCERGLRGFFAVITEELGTDHDCSAVWSEEGLNADLERDTDLLCEGQSQRLYSFGLVVQPWIHTPLVCHSPAEIKLLLAVGSRWSWFMEATKGRGSSRVYLSEEAKTRILIILHHMKLEACDCLMKLCVLP